MVSTEFHPRRFIFFLFLFQLNKILQRDYGDHTIAVTANALAMQMHADKILRKDNTLNKYFAHALFLCDPGEAMRRETKAKHERILQEGDIQLGFTL